MKLGAYLAVSGDVEHSGDTSFLPLGLLNELGCLSAKIVVLIRHIQASAAEVVEEVIVGAIQVDWLKHVGGHVRKWT